MITITYVSGFIAGSAGLLTLVSVDHYLIKNTLSGGKGNSL